MAGNEVGRWELAGFPSELIDPSINGGNLGTFIVQTKNKAGMGWNIQQY